MKQGWEILKLAEVCEIINGGTPDTTVPKYWDGENLWITPKDMGKLEGIYVYDTPRKITDAGLKNSSAKILPTNSIILSSRAPIGHLAINKKPISTNQGCKGLVPQKMVSTLYIYYFLSKSVDLLNGLGTGATFKELSGSKLATVEIPLPPLSEQKRIVAILDEAFAAIAKAKANAEKNLKNAKELFESYLQSVFANKVWEEKTFGEVCEFVRGPFGGSLKKNIFKPDGYAIYEQQHAIYDQFNDIRYFIDEKKFNEMKRFELSAGDLIMSCSGTMGKTAIVPKNIKKGIINQALLKLTPSPKLSVFFLKLWMQSENFQERLKEHSQGAAIQNVASVKILKGIKIPLPTLNVQNSIIQNLDALSSETKKLEAIYQQKLNDLEELKKSILQKAFNGGL